MREIKFRGKNQYTGFTDKNSIEIYEEDLLKYKDYVFKVIFECGAFCLKIESDDYIPYDELPTDWLWFESVCCDNVVSFFELTYNDEFWSKEFEIIKEKNNE